MARVPLAEDGNKSLFDCSDVVGVHEDCAYIGARCEASGDGVMVRCASCVSCVLCVLSICVACSPRAYLPCFSPSCVLTILEVLTTPIVSIQCTDYTYS